MCTCYTFLQKICYIYLTDIFDFFKCLFSNPKCIHNVTSCIKLTFLITNGNAEPYYSELHLKKIRLKLLRIVKTLGHIMPPTADLLFVTAQLLNFS